MSITVKQLKGPKGLPILGNLFTLDRNNMHVQMEAWAKEFGSVFRLALPTGDIAVVTEPEVIDTILKNRPSQFSRLDKTDKVLRDSGVHGVFNAEGNDWDLHRRMVSKGLDVKHQKDFFPQMCRTIERLHKKWSKNADNNEIIDLQSDFLRFTVDITVSLAFGYEMNTIEEEGGVIQDHLEKVLPMFFKRIMEPIPWHKILSSKKDKEFDHALKNINVLVDDLIAQGRKRLQDDPSLRKNPKNFIEAILVAAEEEEGFTDDHVKGNLITLLIAGEETTATTLSWAIYLLTKHPETQERIVQESNNILGDSAWLEEYGNHSKFTYIDSVTNEVMRLKPATPMLFFQALETVEIGNFVFEKGQRFLIQTRYAGLQDENFTEASDFNPSRWIKESRCPVHDTSSFIPFGGGPRFCPGRNLALLEIQMVLSMLFKNFELEMVSPHEEVKEVMALTMMASDYKIRIKHRT